MNKTYALLMCTLVATGLRGMDQERPEGFSLKSALAVSADGDRQSCIEVEQKHYAQFVEELCDSHKIVGKKKELLHGFGKDVIDLAHRNKGFDQLMMQFKLLDARNKARELVYHEATGTVMLGQMQQIAGVVPAIATMARRVEGEADRAASARMHKAYQH